MTDVPRRAVLGAGLGVVGLAVVGVDAPAADATGVLPRRAHYARSVGRTFTAGQAHRTHRLKLIRVHNVAGTTAAERDRCFNLIFTVVGGRHLPDAIYTIARKGVPTQHLFLSRIGHGTTMQALVNRSV